MRSKLLAVTAAGLFALGLTACEQGERPATDRAPPAATSPGSPGGETTPGNGSGSMGSGSMNSGSTGTPPASPGGGGATR